MEAQWILEANRINLLNDFLRCVDIGRALDIAASESTLDTPTHPSSKQQPYYP